MYEWLRALLLPFLDLVNCKPLVPSKRLLSPRVSMRTRSSHKSSPVNVCCGASVPVYNESYSQYRISETTVSTTRVAVQ